MSRAAYVYHNYISRFVTLMPAATSNTLIANATKSLREWQEQTLRMNEPRCTIQQNFQPNKQRLPKLRQNRQENAIIRNTILITGVPGELASH